MRYTVKRLDEFAHWLIGLKDPVTRQRLNKHLLKLSLGNLGDIAPVGEGVLEMREHFWPGWRMYCIVRGQTLVIMLGGGDKSTPSKDIRQDIELAQQLGD
jgi:putative addiction module killer protein